MGRITRGWAVSDLYRPAVYPTTVNVNIARVSATMASGYTRQGVAIGLWSGMRFRASGRVPMVAPAFTWRLAECMFGTVRSGQLREGRRLRFDYKSCYSVCVGCDIWYDGDVDLRVVF